MRSRERPCLVAVSALLLCTAASSSASAAAPASPSEVRGGSDAGTWMKQTDTDYGSRSKNRPAPKLKEGPGRDDGFPLNTSRRNSTTVTSERPGRMPRQSPEEGASPLCAYRVIEAGIGGQLCFRHTLLGYKCHEGDCRTAVSVGNLVANILTNGSVLLQWSREGNSTVAAAERAAAGGAPGTRVFAGRRHRRAGYELSCWWNGSYTQFECAGVHLGSGCADFLLTELHENIPYRLCLRSVARADPAERRDCVEFTLPPSGMQDIVIAMTTVGGAICVMLVIICLLVAYITENIMSPTTQHTYSYRTHSRH
ncbi:fibronectin type III domain-containing protein 10 [Betta splendens]|uniref:Fibronectin type III domain-containing protein 10 n=1 Tax=Betta splendens TaxID=158456 RepID=A0A6P7MKN4_BETSP|nr:fibronectin type III domain-containing protein 10 [Betta splendens]